MTLQQQVHDCLVCGAAAQIPSQRADIEAELAALLRRLGGAGQRQWARRLARCSSEGDADRLFCVAHYLWHLRDDPRLSEERPTIERLLYAIGLTFPETGPRPKADPFMGGPRASVDLASEVVDTGRVFGAASGEAERARFGQSGRYEPSCGRVAPGESGRQDGSDGQPASTLSGSCGRVARLYGRCHPCLGERPRHVHWLDDASGMPGMDCRPRRMLRAGRAGTTSRLVTPTVGRVGRTCSPLLLALAWIRGRSRTGPSRVQRTGLTDAGEQVLDGEHPTGAGLYGFDSTRVQHECAIMTTQGFFIDEFGWAYCPQGSPKDPYFKESFEPVGGRLYKYRFID